MIKFYFWNGGEFKNTAAPCCEIHTKTKRIKLMVIGRNKIKWFYWEKL
jgi:hypothetical protein